MRLKIASLLLIVALSVTALMYHRFDPATDVRPTKQISAGVKEHSQSDVGSVSIDRMPSLHIPIPSSVATHSAITDGRASAAKSTQRVSALENELKHLRDTTLAYLMLIDALKSEVHLRGNELQKLQSTVAEYESEITILSDKLAHHNIAMYTSNVDERIDKKSVDVRHHRAVNEHVDYFTVAKRVEASAKKIRSSDLKREHLLEALEGYKKAFSLGRKEAAQNIDELEEILFPSSTGKY